MKVIYQGRDYIVLVQHATGYCEIVEVGIANQEVKMVHFSELKIKNVNSD